MTGPRFNETSYDRLPADDPAGGHFDFVTLGNSRRRVPFGGPLGVPYNDASGTLTGTNLALPFGAAIAFAENGLDSFIPGPPGNTGAAGATGPQGPQGSDGAPGTCGDPGSDSYVPGPQGSTGAQGAQGVQGAQGATGSQGATGAQGANGVDGVMGPPGMEGDNYPDVVSPIGSVTTITTPVSIFDPASVIFEYDDFLYGFGLASTAPTAPGQKTLVSTSGSGAGGTNAILNKGAGHQGVISLGTGTTSSGFCAALGCCTANNSSTIQLGDGIIRYDHEFKTDTSLSDGTNRYYLFVGIADINTSTPSNGLGLFYRDNVNSGAWGIISWVAGVQQTIVSTGISAAADTWYHTSGTTNAARNNTSISINGVAGGSFTGTHPATSVGLGPSMQISKSVGGTSRLLYPDYWMIFYPLDTPR